MKDSKDIIEQIKALPDGENVFCNEPNHDVDMMFVATVDDLKALVAKLEAAEALVAEYEELLADAVNIRLWMNDRYESIDEVDTCGYTGPGDEYYPPALEAFRAIKEQK